VIRHEHAGPELGSRLGEGARTLDLHVGVPGRPGRGQALSGVLAERAGIQQTLLLPGLGIVATTALGLVARLPDATTDVSPWNFRRWVRLRDSRPTREGLNGVARNSLLGVDSGLASQIGKINSISATTPLAQRARAL